MKKHVAKRLRSGKYLYRGFEIRCHGYYSPEQRVVWEAIDADGRAFAHSFSLKHTKGWVDEELDSPRK